MAVLSNHNHSSFRRCSSRHTLLSRRDRALSSSLQLSTALLSSVELLHLFPFSIFSPVAAQQLPYLPPILMTPIIDSSWHRCQLQYRKLSTLCWLYCQLPYRQQASPQHRLWSFKDLTPLVTTKPFSAFKGLFLIALPLAAL